MNLYEKIQTIKSELIAKDLKKSGENKFAKFKYYELNDFLPAIISLCLSRNVFTSVSFTNENAILSVINIDDTSERFEITSPMKEGEIKGATAIQNLGGVETYQRRYLYMALFDITENDMNDAGREDKDEPLKLTKELQSGIKEYGVDLEKLKAYLKKDNLTTTDIKKAIESKKQAAEKAKGGAAGA